MRQMLCDRCAQPITVNGRQDQELVKVNLTLGWDMPLEDGWTWEYHRGCVREMTAAEIYKRAGLLPL